jgi:hypothetical protein
MKKIISHIIICFLVVAIQLLMEVTPLTRYQIKLTICETSIEELIKHEKWISYTAKMSQAEKDQLIILKKEICNQQ